MWALCSFFTLNSLGCAPPPDGGLALVTYVLKVTVQSVAELRCAPGPCMAAASRLAPREQVDNYLRRA